MAVEAKSQNTCLFFVYFHVFLFRDLFNVGNFLVQIVFRNQIGCCWARDDDICVVRVLDCRRVACFCSNFIREDVVDIWSTYSALRAAQIDWNVIQELGLPHESLVPVCEEAVKPLTDEGGLYKIGKVDSCLFMLNPVKSFGKIQHDEVYAIELLLVEEVKQNML